MARDEERVKKRAAPKNPEKVMQRLLEANLGVTVDAKVLRKFLIDNWGLVSHFAHAIHDQDMAKAKE